jgi:hypothetical protein
MGARAVDWARLESVCTERYRGFESRPIRGSIASNSSQATYVVHAGLGTRGTGNASPGRLVTRPLSSNHVGFLLAPWLVVVLVAAAPAGQIVISHGGTYTFTVYNDDPNRAAVEVRPGIFVQLKGCSIYSKGPGIVADAGASVSLDGCLVWIMNPDKYGALASQGIVTYDPNYFVVDHTWVNGASIGVYVYDDRPQTSAWVVVWHSRISNWEGRASDGKGGWLPIPIIGGVEQNYSHGILFNGLHGDGNAAIEWNELYEEYGKAVGSDAINIYRSGGATGRPLWVLNNYVQGVVASRPGNITSASGIVTDGNTADPAIATANVRICSNQVVGCAYTGIALAFGLNEVADHNTVVSSGLAPDGTRLATAFVGVCIEGDHRYQPAEWLNWLELRNNTVGVNGLGSARTDLVLWYPELSSGYVQGTQSLHDGPITLTDEAAQLTAWKSKIAMNGVKIGP